MNNEYNKFKNKIKQRLIESLLMEEDKNQPPYRDIPEGQFPYELIPVDMIAPGAGLWIRAN